VALLEFLARATPTGLVTAELGLFAYERLLRIFLMRLSGIKRIQGAGVFHFDILI
jgi:hypothetical protein